MIAVGLSACAPEDGGADAFRGDGNVGYNGESLRVTEIAVADRGEPVVFSGETEDGSTFSSDSIRGEVAVVNFWYASCGPCRIEAKDLESVWKKHEGDGVKFIGVNIYDAADTAKAFAEEYGITYPSILDADSGDAKLAFAKVAPLQAPPTTLVLDRKGRVAARILGPIDGTSVLSTLIKDLLAEKA